MSSESERVHGHIIDMINQCRYIASKKGMDKHQLIASIRQDEMEKNDYITALPFTPTLIPVAPLHPFAQWKVPHCIKEVPKITFLTTPNIVTSDDESESDFDPSQSFDLFDEINSANASVNKRRCYDQVGAVEIEKGSSSSITPIRRPGTHNLLTALDDTRNEELSPEMKKSEIQVSSKLSGPEQELLKSCDNEEQYDELYSSEEDEDCDDAKQLMITTARAKACSSYIQLRQKAAEGCTKTTSATITRAPMFGSLDEFDQHLMMSNFSRLLVAKEAVAQKTLQNNKQINNN